MCFGFKLAWNQRVKWTGPVSLCVCWPRPLNIYPGSALSELWMGVRPVFYQSMQNYTSLSSACPTAAGPQSGEQLSVASHQRLHPGQGVFLWSKLFLLYTHSLIEHLFVSLKRQRFPVTSNISVRQTGPAGWHVVGFGEGLCPDWALVYFLKLIIKRQRCFLCIKGTETFLAEPLLTSLIETSSVCWPLTWRCCLMKEWKHSFYMTQERYSTWSSFKQRNCQGAA